MKSIKNLFVLMLAFVGITICLPSCNSNDAELSIHTNYSTISVGEGNTRTVKVTVNGGTGTYNFTATTSNTDVATVGSSSTAGSFIVYAISAGSCNVTVTLDDYPKVKKIIPVKVHS